MSQISGTYHARRVFSQIPHRSGRPSRIPMIKPGVTSGACSDWISTEPVTRKIGPSYNCISPPSSLSTALTLKRHLSEVHPDTSNKRQTKYARTDTGIQSTGSQSINDSLSDPVKWSDFKNEPDATMNTDDSSEATFDHSCDLFSHHQSIMLESPPAGFYTFPEACSPGLKRPRSTSIDEVLEFPPTKRNRIEDSDGQVLSIHPSKFKTGIIRLTRRLVHTLKRGSKAQENPYEQEINILESPDINPPAGSYGPTPDNANASSTRITNIHSQKFHPVFAGVEESVDPALKTPTPSNSLMSATPPVEPTQPSAVLSHKASENTSGHDSNNSACNCHQAMGGLLEEIHNHFERLTEVLLHFKK